MYKLDPFDVVVPDLRICTSLGSPVLWISAKECGIKPSASSTEETISGSLITGLTLGRAAGVLKVEAWAASAAETLMEEVVEAVVDVLPRETLEAASSSLSVSPRSSGALMAGAESKKSKGSKPVPFPKNCTNKVQSSLQSEPAKAINRCWRASALSAEALCSSSAARRKSLRACKTKGGGLERLQID